MRLIDKDDLITTILTNDLVNKKCGSDIAILNAPIVEAIPIEWIKKWQANHTIEGTTRNLVIFGLLHDWEKENEID